MKKLLLPLLAILFLISCEKESTTELIPEQEQVHENGTATSRSADKRDVCHNGNIINISVNAIPGHQAHGDAVDMDGDGYFDIDNPCSETDCDDTTYDPENSCGCLEGEVEIDFNGTSLFVAPFDEGLFSWQEAKDVCEAKAGCEWRLPNKEELEAMYDARGDIPNMAQAEPYPRHYYWSSTETDPLRARAQSFRIGQPLNGLKTQPFSCRCVR